MLDLLTWYHRQSNAWWKINGKFTIWDFLTLMLMFDWASGSSAISLLTEAAARQLYSDGTSVGTLHPNWCDATCSTGNILNYLAGKIQSASSRANNYAGGTIPEADLGFSGASSLDDGFLKDYTTISGSVSSLLMNPQNAWRVWNNHSPYYWGNGTVPGNGWIAGVTIDQVLTENPGTYEKAVFFLQFGIPRINNFAVWSPNQDAAWRGR